jgi:AcrR family transcriptional regulator
MFHIDDPAAMETSTSPKTARGEATRRAILSAAEAVIGSRGYNDASIIDITREAGVAQGTFYIYFKSKDEVFSQLVVEMGRLLRRALNEATATAADRLTAEKAGLRGFLTFVTAHPNLYRIVQEALFVDPAAYRAYFQTFADGYREALAEAEAAGEIRPGDPDVRAWALMGIAKTLGERAVVWGDETPVERVVEAAHDLIVNGLKR